VESKNRKGESNKGSSPNPETVGQKQSASEDGGNKVLRESAEAESELKRRGEKNEGTGPDVAAEWPKIGVRAIHIEGT